MIPPNEARNSADQSLMAPAVLVDVGLEAFGHPRRLAIHGLIAKRARHPRSTAAAAVRAFPRPARMLLAYPSAIVAACADSHARQSLPTLVA